MGAQMSGGFLGRWSQRKLSEKQKEETPRSVSDAPDREDGSLGSPDRDTAPQGDSPETFAVLQQEEMFGEEELAALPSLDSITAQTDLRQFLRKGVPAALKNAALRKIWLLDPAIRNHVDYAVDYAWDWNVPGGVPGHGGQITGESVAKMLDNLLPKPISDENRTELELPDQAPDAALGANPPDPSLQPESDPAPSAEAGQSAQSDGDAPDQKLQNMRSPERPEVRMQALETRSAGDAVARPDDHDRPTPRRHGGALPI